MDRNLRSHEELGWCRTQTGRWAWGGQRRLLGGGGDIKAATVSREDRSRQRELLIPKSQNRESWWAWVLQLRMVGGGEAAGWGLILGTWEAKQKAVGTGPQGGPRCVAAIDGHHLQAAPRWEPPSWPRSASSPAPSLPPLSSQGHWAAPPPLSPGAGAGQGEAEKGEAEEVGRKRGA